MSVVTSNPEVIMADLSAWASAQARSVASTLFTELHENTPKDTGFAASKGFPPVGGIAFRSFGTMRPDHRTKSVDSSTFGRGIAIIWREWTPTAPLFITNSVPYIGRLEAGWSPQGSGFIEAAVTRAMLTPPTENYGLNEAGFV